MDYEKIETAIALLDENSSKMSSQSEAQLDIDFEELAYDDNDSSDSIQSFLESQFGSDEELEMKKIMALTAVAAGSDSSASEIASQADASAVYAKVAYKVNTGELDVIEATEVIIDHGAARLNTLMQENLDMEMTGELIADTIAVAYPPAKVAKPFIKAIVKKAEPMVRKVICSGIKQISTYAKEAVRSVAYGLKNFAKSLLNA